MISEKELQIAAKEYEQLMLDSLPDPDQCEASFSPRFERRMKKLIVRADHPFRYWVQKSAACFLLLVLLGGGGLLTFSTEARAAFFGWIREFYGDYFEYHYEGENQSASEDIVYRPTWVPDGYEVASESHDPGCGDIIYRNEHEGRIIFSWSLDMESSVFQVYPETAEIKKTLVGNCPADLYVEHDEGMISALVWSNQEERVIYSISATLSEDEIIQIAESVRVQNSANPLYYPTWVPDGYEVTSESHDPGYGCIIYRSGNEGMIGFTWSEDIESSVSHVYPETAEIKNTFIGDNPADLYLEHGEGLSSCLVWSNREEKVLFVISATLSEDEIIRMAESVEVQSIE